MIRARELRMPLYLNNDDQQRATGIPEAIEAMERMLRLFARGDAIRRPRIDNYLPSTRADEFFCFSSMEGGSRAPGYYALRIKPDIVSWPRVDDKVRRKNYAVQPGLYGGLVLLYDTGNAEFLALLNDGHVQHVRVAATAALGVKYMAKADAKVLGVIGSGGMARFFAMAIKAVRPIERVQAYSPNRGRLEEYCAEIAARLRCEVVACRSAREAAGDADIVSFCTNSQEPVIEPEHIRPGVHVTNVLTTELSAKAFARIEVVGLLARRTPMSAAGYVDDDYGGIRGSAMSYVGGQPAERDKVPFYPKNPDRYPNARYVDCVNAGTGEPYRRERPDEITTLATNSNGVLEGETGPSSGFQGLQFAAVAGAMYESARRMGIGTELPGEMFLQDIPT
jgi:ornithine cyclodeaminase/alanine dehydrogenase-like protein (mu-crystallin family)